MTRDRQRGLVVEYRSLAELRPNPRNARTHSKKQIAQLGLMMNTVGFTNPILIDDQNGILAGHCRYLAAKAIGLESVPTIRISDLTPEELRAYIIADNKLALNAGWDFEILAGELQGLLDLGFDIELTGFSIAEADLVFQQADDADSQPRGPEDDIPEPGGAPVSRLGDMWRLGPHCVICGDAREAEIYGRLLEGRSVDLVFTDPPYNVPIDGHVSGAGRVRHREFAMASGEMTEAQFKAFLFQILDLVAKACRNGAIAFVCMDWRHMGVLHAVGLEIFSELKNLCVWNKTNGGMGAFYRSKHELIFVYKVGDGPHVNTFGLGDKGRYRTNVWDYPGISSFGAGRDEALAMHPTVKPVALVMDAIKDCSRRGDLVLDPFGGSGTTLIAAHRCGRIARLIEFDPLYCDTILRRWEKLTGKTAFLSETSQTFEAVAAARAGGGSDEQEG